MEGSVSVDSLNVFNKMQIIICSAVLSAIFITESLHNLRPSHAEDSPVWSPALKKDIVLIRRRFTKRIPKLATMKLESVQ